MVIKQHLPQIRLILLSLVLILQPMFSDNYSISYDDNSVVYNANSISDDLTTDLQLYDNSHESWQVINIGGPSAREHASMAYSNDDNITLLFGGRNGNNNFSDTWIFFHNNNSWSEISITSPTARYGASLAYDVGDNTFILFGGMTSNGISDEIWTFSYSTLMWQKSATIMTYGCYFASATYYKRYDTTYIYGGITNTSVSSQLNSYNSTSGGFTQIYSGSPAYSRFGHSLISVDYLDPFLWPDVYGPINAFQLLITGGYTQSGVPTSSGLQFDGSSMVALSSVFNTPTAFHTMVFDDAHFRIYNYGGRNSTHIQSNFVVGSVVSNSLNPTWEIIDSGTSLTNHSMVWVEHNQELMVFGGSRDGVVLGNTQTTRLYSPYGGPHITPKSDITLESGDAISIGFTVYDSVRFLYGSIWFSVTYPIPDPSHYVLQLNGEVIEQGTWFLDPYSSTMIFANFTSLPLGIHTVNLWVNDTTGWSTEEYIDISVVDTIAPSLTSQEIYVTGSYVSILWLPYDLNPDTYTISFGNGTILSEGTWESGNLIGLALYQLPVGSYFFNLTIFDVSGNSVSDYIDVTIGVNTVVTPTVTSTVTSTVTISDDGGGSVNTLTQTTTETTTEGGIVTVTSEETTTVTEPAPYQLVIFTPFALMIVSRRSWRLFKNKRITEIN